jgi:hypothetical protein
MPNAAAALAQLVEHIIRNDGVRCSSHLSGTNLSDLFLWVVMPSSLPHRAGRKTSAEAVSGTIKESHRRS